MRVSPLKFVIHVISTLSCLFPEKIWMNELTVSKLFQGGVIASILLHLSADSLVHFFFFTKSSHMKVKSTLVHVMNNFI